MAAPKISPDDIQKYIARAKWLPDLFVLSSTGAVQVWRVGTFESSVVTSWGQNGGAQQWTVDTLKEGKNLGKKNATTPEQQAEIKAQQLFDKKVKDGYVTDFAKAKRGEADVEGIEPMLAFPIEDKEKYVKFPAFAQPKLDGFRCVAIVKDGSVRLFSRTRKEIKTLPHIVFQLSHIFKGQTITLDGELYNHKLKDDFNKIASTIKRDEVHPDHEIIQYWVYDIAGPGGYHERTKAAFHLLHHAKAPNVRVIDTYSVLNRDALNKMHDIFTKEGYEGAMYRSLEGAYENKRSPSLLKVKKFSDAEFEVIDKVEGNGKFAGKLGAFVCVTKHGQKFNVAMNGELETLEDYLVNFEIDYKNQMLTVQYQGLTPDGIPRFPRGLRFRQEI